MGLRPVAAQWFEVLTPREELTRALRCLAATGAVELQTHSQTATGTQLPDLHEGLHEYRELYRRFADWWPKPEPEPLEAAAEPAQQLETALASVRRWADDAAPLIVEIQNSTRVQHDLETLREAIAVNDDALPDLHQLASSGPYLAGRLYVLPDDQPVEESPPSVLLQPVNTETHSFLFAVGTCSEVESLDDTLTALKARRLELPEWLPAKPSAAGDVIARRLAAARQTEAELTTALVHVHDTYKLSAALGELQLLDWYVTHVPELPVTERFAWISGWTSDPDAKAIDQELGDRGIHHLLRVSKPPANARLPVVLRNPSWARPFERFAMLLGTPGNDDVDPSIVVALIAPLMFGYMFGDVGQGAVLLMVGLLLRRRLPLLSLLIPGGIAAIVFGFVFGSVFGNSHLIPALWVHPIDEPVPVLVASLMFGVTVMTLGLGLDARQWHWRGEGAQLWSSRLGLVLTYFGVLFAVVFDARVAWIAVFGAVWFILGSALIDKERGRELARRAAGEYIETVLQLLVNTVSFIRVGAFALAHAGLSLAVVDLAGGVEATAGKVLVLVLGNALVIALEGLVVGVQTTRLVLFEFFIRFLRSSGRQFKPLPHPDEAAPGKTRRQS